jgi:hypothetical protein
LPISCHCTRSCSGYPFHVFTPFFVVFVYTIHLFVLIFFFFVYLLTFKFVL